MNRSSPVTLLTNSSVHKNNKLLPGAYDLYGILQITKHTLTLDENVILHIMLIDGATAVTSSITHLRLSKVRKTSLEDKTTHCELRLCTETGTPYPMSKDSCTETVLTSIIGRDSYMETEISTQSKNGQRAHEKEVIILSMRQSLPQVCYRPLRRTITWKSSSENQSGIERLRRRRYTEYAVPITTPSMTL